MSEVPEGLWFVAHTRPRCEKKLVQYCEQQGLSSTLPCYQATHKYTRKTVRFEKPLFPGYVFLRLQPHQRLKPFQSNCVANLLEVTDQALFDSQLAVVLRALEMKVEIHLAPAIGEGQRVQIIRGPVRGVDGWVEQRYGPSTVLLRIDFIGQAAALQLQADEIELI